MKKIILSLITTALFITTLSAETDRSFSLGMHFLAGGRYDDVRMCVGSDERVKGGPIMDIYADLRIPVGTQDYLVLNIPVMRPVLFGAAFQMLQFEPQMTYERHFGREGMPHFVLGGGAGVVFHYGPDYRSSPDNRGDDFFAWGPLVSVFLGREIPAERNSWMPGIKVFYSPLFSEDYDNGNVSGAGLELHYLYR